MNLSLLLEMKKYHGIMAIGDIHNCSDQLFEAIIYSERKYLLPVMLGDMFDGIGGNPLEVVKTVIGLLDTDSAAFVIGNHDDRMNRYAIGNPVKMNPDLQDTLLRTGANTEEFLGVVKKIVNHRNSSICHRVKNAIFAHGSVHPDLWASDQQNGKIRAACLYGEVTGERDDRGFPVREYNWVDSIPSNCYGVIGHDRTAMSKPALRALTHRNMSGGIAVFTDSSCGKIDGAPLTGAVFSFSDSGIEFSEFKEFF